jgi:uncharacterized protein YjiS (DUF1127 family)
MNHRTLKARPTLSVTRPVMHLGRIKRSYTTAGSLATQVASKAASNDSHYPKDKPNQATDELDAWARRAGAANGFGEAISATVDLRPLPDSLPLAIEARTHRFATLLKVVRVVIASLSEAVRRDLAAWRRAREEHATFRALRALDQRTLHDIGLDSSEVRSAASELAGGADRTRIHALMTLRNLAI